VHVGNIEGGFLRENKPKIQNLRDDCMRF
jgi:hypothetical protein